MTTMTDEAAEKIVQKTIDKFKKAKRKVLVVSVNDDEAYVGATMKKEPLTQILVEVIAHIAGDNAEDIFKQAAKDYKKEKKNAKRKKNA